MVRLQTIGLSSKQWVPKDAPAKIADEWLHVKDMEVLLEKLVAVWQDTKGSSYTITQNATSEKLDVATERPNGVVHKTGGLIQVEWDDTYGRVVWGRGGPRRQYTIASFDGKTLRWCRTGSPDFVWQRVGEVHRTRSDIEEPEDEIRINDELEIEDCHGARNETHLHRAKLRREFQRERRQATELYVKPESDEVHIQPPSIDGCEAGRKILAALQVSKENKENENGCGNVKNDAVVSIPEVCAEVVADNSRSSLEDQRSDITKDATEVLLEALKITPKGKPTQQYVSAVQPPVYANLNAMLPQMQQMLPQVPFAPIDVRHVTSQVEYWFTDENLARDSYMRSLMNDQGWVFLGTLQTFHRLQQMSVDMWALRFAIVPSLMLELDGTAQYVRIREQGRRERWAATAPVYQ